MFKHLFSIILALVMAFAMTGCSVADTDTQIPATEACTEATTDITEETTAYTKIELINPTLLMEMTEEEIASIMADLVTISSAKKMSISDMIYLGHNFNNIVSFAPAFDADNFKVEAIKAFDNVYAQCVQQQIPLEKVPSWTNIPVVEILVKYFSGEFSYVEKSDCKALHRLGEQDAITVTKTIFANPAVFAQSALMVYDTLKCPHEEVKKIGLSVLTRNSKTSQLIDSSIAFEFCRILDTNSIVNDVLTVEKLNEIRNNIIENENFDFVAKYFVFCNSNDKEVSSWAHSLLLAEAKQCDTKTAENIKQTIDFLSDENVANELLNLLEENDC